MATAPPYAVDATFLQRVDRAVEGALRQDLNVVLDVHHFDELCADADRHAARFLALWSQIARRYADDGSGLCFEALNEPHEPMTAGRWNDLLAAAVDVIRGSNPERTVIAGPVRWNTVDGLSSPRLPDDARVAVTIHYYSPFRFTHQGADWLEGADRWLGTTWGTDADRARVRTDLERASEWVRDRAARQELGVLGLRDRLRGVRHQPPRMARRHSGRHCSGRAGPSRRARRGRRRWSCSRRSCAARLRSG
jgi:endoglucanase